MIYKLRDQGRRYDVSGDFAGDAPQATKRLAAMVTITGTNSGADFTNDVWGIEKSTNLKFFSLHPGDFTLFDTGDSGIAYTSFVVEGTGFTYSAGRPSAGTITSLSGSGYTVTGLNIGVTHFLDVMRLADSAAFLDLFGAIDFHGSGSNDHVLGGDLADKMSGGAGDDELSGMDGNDVVFGGRGNDVLSAGAGRDRLSGGEGNDILRGDGRDTLDGGSGNDQYIFTGPARIHEDENGGTDKIVTDTDYALLANFENLTLQGPAHNGTGNELNNVITGNDEDNKLFGHAGNDDISGRTGADWLDGGAGDDILDGEDGNDELVGGIGHDRLLGRSGRDLLTGGDGPDSLIGGGDIDLANYYGSSNGLTVNLGNAAANTGEAAGDVYHSIEGIIGSRYDDVLIGTKGNNRIFGAEGRDIMKGGGGADVFGYVVSDFADGVVDRITDFGTGDDHIWLVGMHGDPDTVQLYFDQRPEYQVPSFIYRIGTGTLYYDDDGSGLHKAIPVLKFSGYVNLMFDDFYFG